MVFLPIPHDGRHLLFPFERSHRHSRLRTVPKNVIVVKEVGFFHLRSNVCPPIVREFCCTHLRVLLHYPEQLQSLNSESLEVGEAEVASRNGIIEREGRRANGSKDLDVSRSE